MFVWLRYANPCYNADVEGFRSLVDQMAKSRHFEMHSSPLMFADSVVKRDL